MIKLFLLKLVLLLIVTRPILGQGRYWVNDQNQVNGKSMAIEPEFCSEWLQICSYQLTTSEVDSIKSLGFLVEPVLPLSPLADQSTSRALTFALEQIEGQLLIEQGLTGKGIKIGIIDGGFLEANKTPSLSHVFRAENVGYYKDYVTPDLPEYQGSVGLDDDHGTRVMSMIAGIDFEKNIQFGLAPNATFLLARTDHGGYEKRVEEDYLIDAIEQMTRLGARIINISLGYNTGYMETVENYLPHQMDGKTTKVARAVDFAAKNKGVLMVVAAGNEAKDSQWQIVSSPGDAEGALTVGAAKFAIWDKMDYSSIGPDFIPFLKPNVSVYASTGTSFSTPVISGLAACMLELNPDYSNFQIRQILEKAGHFYPYGNNYLGYGVPTVSNILKIIEGRENEIKRPTRVSTEKNVYLLKGDITKKTIVTYHKKDDRNVIARVNYLPEKNKIKIKRLDGAIRTSILVNNEVIEVFWED